MELLNLSKEDYSNYKTLINSNISEEYFNNFIDNVLNENHLIILLKKDNIIIGSGTILIEHELTYNGCTMGHIENILIDEKYRKQDYGEALVKYLLEICNNRKCYRVDLNCNSELENFYKKNNFNKKHICMNYYFKDNFKNNI